MKLYIANKTYSSWSFRAWLAMKVKKIDFEEILIPLDLENDCRAYREFSPTGKVPVLIDGDIKVWESLAILEYLADKFPEREWWPKKFRDKVRARTLSHEMHAGFPALRNLCPMNMKRPMSAIDQTDSLKREIQRVEQIWTTGLEEYGGPFLFGETFTIADAMYAPVVNRFRIYDLSRKPKTLDYMQAISSLEEWQLWKAEALKETWSVESNEA